MFSSAFAVEVQLGDSVILECPFDVSYPTWEGPSTLATPLTSGSVVNEGGIEFVNETHLRISSAMIKHNGEYICSNGTEQSTTTLDVKCKL